MVFVYSGLQEKQVCPEKWLFSFLNTRQTQSYPDKPGESYYGGLKKQKVFAASAALMRKQSEICAVPRRPKAGVGNWVGNWAAACPRPQT